ncbi:MAG: threonine ammonia-lyase [Verrucomicrobiota bacterium]
MSVTFKDIEAAANRIQGGIVQTPCPLSIPVSELTGMQVFCKLEYLQRTGSFKERGARNALLLLDEAQKKRGVIAASAGNHALGLAYHGALLGIPVTVVMPRFAPLNKVSNCHKFGARVIIEGNNIGEAQERATLVGKMDGLTYINGFDDAAIIAGAGTLGIEMNQQVPEADAIIVPIGGAGLIAGVALALKTLRPEIRIIGVEPERAASFSAALISGRPMPFDLKPTIADGLSVPKVGERGFQIARRYVDKVLVVSEHAIALAILRLLELEKAVVEGAGAITLATCLAGLVPELKGKRVLLPLTGGNIDTPTLGRILERGLTFDGRLCRMSVTISDRPGGLARFASIIAEEGGSIMEVAHDRAFASDDISTVMIHSVIETRDHEHIGMLRKRLAAEGFEEMNGVR